jgi:hypothetical protein
MVFKHLEGRKISMWVANQKSIRTSALWGILQNLSINPITHTVKLSYNNHGYNDQITVVP